MENQNTFMHKVASSWLGPAGLGLVFAAVVWGIQLNFAVLNLTEQTAKLQKQMEIAHEVNADQTVQLARATIILDNIEARLRKLEDK